MNRKLKAKIIERYGSQANFSLIIKKGEPLISRVIHGRCVLDPEEKARWAEALDVPITRVFQAEAHE